MTEAAAAPAAPRTALAVILVLLAWAAAGLPALAEAPLDKASKARAWSVARSMARGGDWVVPVYNEEPRLKKPPLQSWAQAATMTAAGSTDLVLAGLASWAVGLLFAFGPYLLGRALGRPVAGLLGSLALCASRATEVWGASPEHDVPFAGWVALSLAFLARALSPEGRARDSAFAGLAAGAAVLTKGPFALAFVWGTAVVATFLSRRDSGSRGRVRWSLLLPLTLLPALVWLAFVWARLGSIEAIFDEMRRQAFGEGGAHRKGGIIAWVYYVGTIPKAAMPWIVPGAIALAALKRISLGSDPKLIASPRFAWIALAVAFVTLTLTPAKQEHYVLPALPPLFLILGAAFEDALRRWRGVARAGPLTAAAIGAMVLVSRIRDPADLPYGEDAGTVAIKIAVVLAAVWFVCRRERDWWRGTLVGFLVAALGVGLAAEVASRRNGATDDFRDAVAKVPPRVWARPVVGLAAGEREAFDTLMAWTERPWTRVRDIGPVKDRLDRGEAFTLLVPEPEKATIEPVRERLRFLAEVAPTAWKDAKDRVLVYESR